MAGDKLPNGKMDATFGSLAFAVLDCPPPKFTKDEAPDTTTNANVTFRSFGESEHITIENMTIEAAFKADDFKVLSTTMNTREILTLTDKEGTTYVFADTEMMSYESTGFTKEDFPKATIEFKIYTGDEGDTAPVTTIGT